METSRSVLITSRIWTISACARAELASPSAWYLIKIAAASSSLSREMRKRGDSGNRLELRLTPRSSSPEELSQHSQDGADLDHGRADLQQGRDPPGPVVGNVRRPESDSRGKNLTDEVGRVEQRREDSTFLGVSKLSEQCRARDDGKQNSHPENQARNDVHGNFRSC